MALYDSLSNRGRSRELKAKEFISICKFLNVNPMEQQFNDMLRGRKVIRDIDVLKIMLALEVDANELFKVSEQEVGGR